MSSTAVVEMRGISKRFLDVVANDQIDFSLNRGEICALLGENGAGKTTLMNILFGYYDCDEGEILIRGERVDLRSPREAIDRGVGMIHQHFTLVPAQSVLENVMVGAAPRGELFLNRREAHRRLLAIQRRFGLTVDPEARVMDLSVGEQQRVEILKALFREAEILIMDEPTAVLAPAETKELFATLRTLASEGRSIIFISHKLNEVMDISDRVVVLRQGRVTAERRTSETSRRELANLMVGRDVLERLEKSWLAAGEPLLEVRDLSVTDSRGLTVLDSANIVVHRHEVVGVAGVSGNGQSELAEVLFGLRRPRSGSILLHGAPLQSDRPAAAVAGRMARIPEDRIETGLLLDLSVEENLILEDHGKAPLSRRGLMQFEEIHRRSSTLIQEYAIRTAGPDAAAKSLSGGNLQKIILARELRGDPELVVASQPTRGLDVGAMEYVHRQILAQRERGAGVLLISEDLDEIFNLSDRIIVMYEGRIMGDLRASEARREEVGLMMTGVGGEATS